MNNLHEQDQQLLQSYNSSLGSGVATPAVSTGPLRRAFVLTMAAGLTTSSIADEHELLRFYALPLSSTTLSSPPSLRPLPIRMNPAAMLLHTTAEQLGKIQESFSLNKTQLARICKVQRQTIYDWFAQNFEAVDDNAERLAQLFAIAIQFKTVNGPPLDSRAATRTLASGETLLELLTSDRVDEAKVLAACEALSRITERRNSGSSARELREKFGWEEPTEGRSREILEGNLDDLGG